MERAGIIALAGVGRERENPRSERSEPAALKVQLCAVASEVLSRPYIGTLCNCFKLNLAAGNLDDSGANATDAIDYNFCGITNTSFVVSNAAIHQFWLREGRDRRFPAPMRRIIVVEICVRVLFKEEGSIPHS